jgi:hypothetical protein
MVTHKTVNIKSQKQTGEREQAQRAKERHVKYKYI